MLSTHENLGYIIELVPITFAKRWKWKEANVKVGEVNVKEKHCITNPRKENVLGEACWQNRKASRIPNVPQDQASEIRMPLKDEF